MFDFLSFVQKNFFQKKTPFHKKDQKFLYSPFCFFSHLFFILRFSRLSNSVHSNGPLGFSVDLNYGFFYLKESQRTIFVIQKKSFLFLNKFSQNFKLKIENCKRNKRVFNCNQTFSFIN